MAKLEIPSIVVNNTGSSTSMEKTRNSKCRLSKQNEFDEVEEDPPSADAVAVAIADTNQADKTNDNESPPKNDKNDSSTLSTLPRQRSHPKVKLLQRSHALRDDTSPPPPDLELVTNTSNVLSATPTNTIVTQTKNLSNKHHKLGKQGSSQGSLDGSSPCLSRDSSIELYSDSTGTDLNQFLVETLHRSQKDRMMLLKIEQDLSMFAKDNSRQYYRFPQMGSYQRMLVHRVAAYFGMDHNVDQSGMSVIVNKTKNTRVPEKRFRDQIRDELMPEEPKKSILKRDSSSFEEGKDLKSPERQLSSESRRSKSFEEREEEYEKARARIFNQDSSSSQEGPVDSPVRSHESTHNSSRRSSQEDLRWMTDVRPWSSTDSDSSNRPAKLIITKTCASTESETGLSVSRASQTLLKAESADNREALNLRSRPLSVPKASSFGGISVLVRGDSVTSTRSATPRLTKADSFSLNNNNASNGGPSHQLSPNRATIESSAPSSVPETPTSLPVTCATAQTANAVPVPEPNSLSSTSVQVVATTTAATNQTSSQTLWSNSNTVATASGPPSFVQGQTVMWAVSNMESVPPGSVLINPQTGQPYLNHDGSVYRHVPSSPSARPHTFPSMASQPLVVPPPPPAPAPAPAPAPVAALQPQPSSMQTLQPSLVQIPQHQVQAPSQGPPPPPPTQPAAPSQPQPQPQPQVPPVVLYSPLMSTPHSSEQRQFSLDGNTVNDLGSQLSAVSFSHLATDSGASGDGGQMMQPNSAPINQQGYFVRPAGLVANSQMPVYFVPPSVPSAQSQVRVIYPVSFISPGSQNQQTPQSGPQPPQTLAQVSLQNALNAQSQSQITGQFVQGYPMVGYPQLSNQAGGDNFSLSPCYSMNAPSMGIVSGAPAMPNFYPVPTSMGSGATANAGNTSSMNSSQASFMSANLPMYAPMPSITPSPALTPGSCSFSHPQGVYRSSTPPAQPSGTKTLGLALNSPYVGYPIFPQHTSSAQMQPATTPTQSGPGPNPGPGLGLGLGLGHGHGHGHGQAAIFPFPQPVLNSSFPIFRPGMQLMMRSSTPPPAVPAPAPHNLVQTQYGNSPAPMLTKSFSLPADHRFGKLGNEFYVADAAGVPLTDNKNMISALPGNNNNVRPPTSLFGRGIPLLQGDMRLLGPPLQQQLSGPVRALVLPQQRMLTRFQTPPGMNSSVNRPPKMRKQRGKPGTSKLDTAILAAQPSANLPADSSWAHVLEVQSLPDGLKCSEVDGYLEEVTRCGGKVEVIGGDGASDGIATTTTGKRQVLAVFRSDTEAQSALANIKTKKFDLRLVSTKPPS